MEQSKNPHSALLSAGLILVFAAYACVLVKIILLKYGLHAGLRSCNGIPFLFIRDLLHPMTSFDVVLKNVLGNFAIFIPLGVLLPALFPRVDKWWKAALFGLGVSLLFEVLQFIFGLGASDVDDLILNSLGAGAGGALYFFVFSRGKGKLTPRLLSFIFLCVFGLLGVLALWLYAPGELPAVIETVNEQALDGLDTEAYAFSGVPESIGENAVVFSRTYARQEDTAAPPTTWPLAADARYYSRVLSYQFSPNGNIQKTICTYARLDAETAQSLMQSEENLYADIYLDEAGNCTVILLTTYQD